MRSLPQLAGACFAFLVLALAGLESCASPPVQTAWERVDEPHFVSEDGAFTLELPRGWLRSGRVLARDPEGLQAISFNSGPVLSGEQALTVDPGAPELTQAMGEQLAAQPGVQVLECKSVTLDGLPGFRAHFMAEAMLPDDEATPAKQEPLPVKQEHLLYGVIDGEMLYAFSLEAPAGADFAGDLAEFEAMVASFKRVHSQP